MLNLSTLLGSSVQLPALRTGSGRGEWAQATFHAGCPAHAPEVPSKAA
jgi:hypothetical protein